jgi:hypothetical protein
MHCHHFRQGVAGIRAAIFETLDWASPIRGILSMRDLMAVPGEAAMAEYIAGRRERGLVLRSSALEITTGPAAGSRAPATTTAWSSTHLRTKVVIVNSYSGRP